MIKPNQWKNVPEDKKEKLLSASIEEFAEYGFEKASTNRIIKKAEISKGLLFHYFGNKKTLYLATLDLVTEKLNREFNNRLGEKNSRDIFDKILIFSKIKLFLHSQYPLEYRMIMEAYLNIPESLKEELTARYEEIYKTGYLSFINDIDYSKFNSTIDHKKAVGYIWLAVEGFSNKYMQTYKERKEDLIKDMPLILTELEEFLNMLKNGFYPAPTTRDD